MNATTEQLSFFEPVPVAQPRPGTEGALRKANGQFLAARRAGHLWQENALLALDRFVTQLKRDQHPAEFTFEEFRLYCDAERLPEPKSVNAWGALPAQACRRGLCRWTGRVQPTVRAAAHNRIVKIWVAL